MHHSVSRVHGAVDGAGGCAAARKQLAASAALLPAAGFQGTDCTQHAASLTTATPPAVCVHVSVLCIQGSDCTYTPHVVHVP